MAQAPKRLCRRCTRGVVDPATGACSKCGVIPRHGWQDDKERGTRHERGYDNAWLKLAAVYKLRHPFCEDCLARGRHVPVDEVHHKTPFSGMDDPLRLDWSNLRSLCKLCHAKYTGQKKRTSARQRPPG